MTSYSPTTRPPPWGTPVLANPLSLAGGVRSEAPAACGPSAYMSASCPCDFLVLRELPSCGLWEASDSSWAFQGQLPMAWPLFPEELSRDKSWVTSIHSSLLNKLKCSQATQTWHVSTWPTSVSKTWYHWKQDLDVCLGLDQLYVEVIIFRLYWSR